MSDIVFSSGASAPPAAPAAPAGAESAPNQQAPALAAEADIEPLAGREGAIAALQLGDDPSILSEGDQQALGELGSYLENVIKAKGVAPTREAYDRELLNMRFKLGLDLEAEPAVVIERAGAVMQAWKDLSFITNPQEKRQAFMKLARMQDSVEMNHYVFDLMERKRVWQR